ncbi:MAG: hypothetical protein ACLGI9_26480, partial [Thermoanaerobaculia bacterium]
MAGMIGRGLRRRRAVAGVALMPGASRLGPGAPAPLRRVPRVGAGPVVQGGVIRGVLFPGGGAVGGMVHAPMPGPVLGPSGRGCLRRAVPGVVLVLSAGRRLLRA